MYKPPHTSIEKNVFFDGGVLGPSPAQTVPGSGQAVRLVAADFVRRIPRRKPDCLERLLIAWSGGWEGVSAVLVVMWDVSGGMGCRMDDGGLWSG